MLIAIENVFSLARAGVRPYESRHFGAGLGDYGQILAGALFDDVEAALFDGLGIHQLAAHGHRFRTGSDTEVIVHGYEQWGERCVEKFRGMFAFAVWDASARRLLLARDRVGVKPLYYAELPGRGIVFGSELKALLEPDGMVAVRLSPASFSARIKQELVQWKQIATARKIVAE